MLRRYRTGLIIALLLLFALAQIFSADLRGKQELGFLERTLVAITSPPQKILTYIIDRSHQAWLNYIFLVDARKNYKELQKDHRTLVMEAARLKETAEENIRLRTLLGLKENLPLEMVAARVISFGSSSFTHSVRIDKGFADGLREGMPVVTFEGVVGHIINTTKNYANVLLLIDPSSSIDVRNQTTRAQGILQGQGTYNLRIDYLTRQAEMKIKAR
jgi:rod shape-determining protein MreC